MATFTRDEKSRLFCTIDRIECELKKMGSKVSVLWIGGWILVSVVIGITIKLIAG